MPDDTRTEIKGLGMATQAIRRSIALLRKELSDLHHDSWDLQKTIAELRDQISQTHTDLKFEAGNLTNGPTPVEPGAPVHPLSAELDKEHGVPPFRGD